MEITVKAVLAGRPAAKHGAEWDVAMGMLPVRPCAGVGGGGGRPTDEVGRVRKDIRSVSDLDLDRAVRRGVHWGP